MDEANIERQIPLAWLDVDAVPIFLANQFVCQFNQDEFILTIGQMVPPAIVGTPEEQAEQVEQVDFVPVKPLARIAFTRARLFELVQVLEANREQYDRVRQQRNEQMGGGGST